MDRIQLIPPAMEHRRAAEEYKQEFFDQGETEIHGGALLDRMEYPQWLENTRKNSDPRTVRDDWVVASTFFAVREFDGRIVGIIDIRHSLDQPLLAQYGGHIGYSVRPSERRKGYAAQMLRLALDYAGGLGLDRVMLGCCSDNLASKKTIERCGGRLAETKPYPDGKSVDVYWIERGCGGV